MSQATAKAQPRKEFFLEMFTRDLSLEDSLLDLIDNSVDSLLRRSPDIVVRVLRGGTRHTKSPNGMVDLTVEENRIVIEDDCGGISQKDAKHDVFCFGHVGPPTGRLGAYGIGLKRAIFKVAENVTIESYTRTKGFSVTLDVDAWAADQNNWTLPIQLHDRARRPCTTSIRFTKLRKEVSLRLRDKTFIPGLTRMIARTYGFFLEDSVRVRLNSRLIRPDIPPVGSSVEIKPAIQVSQDNGVTTRIVASVAPRDRWEQAIGGWYVLCNGRVVVAADKSELTGWGIRSSAPAFHSKYRGFVGVVLFESADPLKLPWTTTKRGLNRESPVYQRTLQAMMVTARGILDFLNALYPSDATESVTQRAIARGVSGADLRKLSHQRESHFRVTPKGRPRSANTVSIQYEANKADVELVKKHLSDPSMSARDVGKRTFEHFLKTECGR